MPTRCRDDGGLAVSSHSEGTIFKKKTSEGLVVFGGEGNCQVALRLVGISRESPGRPPGKLERRDLQTNVLSFDKIVYPFHICHFIGPAGRLSLSSLLGDPPHPSTPTPLPPLRPHHTRARNLHFHFAAERLSAGDKQALFTPFCSCEGPVFFHRRHSPKRFTCRWVGGGGGRGGRGSPLEAKWHGGVWFPRWKRASVDVSGNALNQRGSVKKVQVRKPRSSAIGRKQAGADEVDRSAPRGTRSPLQS